MSTSAEDRSPGQVLCSSFGTPQDRATSLYRQISARGWNKSEAGYVPIEKPRALRKLAEIAYGPGPNTERFAVDFHWSYDLAISVLNQHATPEELPFNQSDGIVDRSNVIELHSRQARGGRGDSSSLLR